LKALENPKSELIRIIGPFQGIFNSIRSARLDAETCVEKSAAAIGLSLLPVVSQFGC
jgi:hypothetical protein